MKIKIFILASSICLCGNADANNSQNAIDLSGKWCNQLGSHMELSINGSNVDGKYYTAVGNADGSYVLRGRRLVNDDGSQNLGFVVAWENQLYKNSHSVTAWAGQAQIIDGKPTITTQWLLVRQTPSEKNWESTWVNKDIFTRCNK